MSMHVTIEPTAQRMAANACESCCCAPVAIKPGEVQMMVLNYAVWTVPMGGRGLIPTTQIAIEPDNGSCDTSAIDGYAPPSIAQQTFATPINVAKSGNLGAQIQPQGNQFHFELMHLYLAQHGSVVLNGNGIFTYTPMTGFVGYDYFWYKATDAQGRTLVRYAEVAVGDVTTTWVEHKVPTYGLTIDRSQVVIHNAWHQVSFPIELSPSALGSVDGCTRYRVTVRQPANDCERTYYNISCFDVHGVKC